MATVSEVAREKLLKVSYPLIKWIGKTHSPWSHKKVNAAHYYQFLELSRPGMVYLTRCEGEASNLLIPGFYTHAAIFAGNHTVIEAVGNGVVKTDLIDFILRKDYVALLCPTFANQEQMDAAVRFAAEQIGTPYDYDFKGGNKAFYCSELVFSSYDAVLEQTPFELRETWGIVTATPQDIRNAEAKWHLLRETVDVGKAE